jgi:hypothetical protein
MAAFYGSSENMLTVPDCVHFERKKWFFSWSIDRPGSGSKILGVGDKSERILGFGMQFCSQQCFTRFEKRKK